MTEGNELDDAKTGMEIIGQVIKTAGDSAEAKEAANNFGKTAVTLTKFVNNVLLPLAAFNYGCDKAREYFSEGRFEKDFAPLADKVPEELRVQPKASIAGPALQGLAFSHEEQELKDMYLNLLAKSMDGRVASQAHPAFVEIIKQLTSEEARLFKPAAQNELVAIAQIRMKSGTGYVVGFRHVLPITDTGTGEKVVVENIAAMVDNWVRLGLVEVDYGERLTGQNDYDWVQERPEFHQCKQQEAEDRKATVQRGVLRVTNLGRQFAKVVGIV